MGGNRDSGVLEVELGDDLDDERRVDSKGVSVSVGGLWQVFVERFDARLCWDQLCRGETSTGFEGALREATVLK